MSLNSVTLQGNLTKDPEYKTTPSGVAVTTFTIAVSRDYAKATDEVKADFFNVVAWRNTAEFVAKYFTKGKAIIVDGNLQNRSWTAQDGSKRYVTEVIADKCYFCGKQDTEAIAPTANPATVQSAIVGMANNFEQLNTNEDLPF